MKLVVFVVRWLFIPLSLGCGRSVCQLYTHSKCMRLMHLAIDVCFRPVYHNRVRNIVSLLLQATPNRSETHYVAGWLR